MVALSHVEPCEVFEFLDGQHAIVVRIVHVKLGEAGVEELKTRDFAVAVAVSGAERRLGKLCLLKAQVFVVIRIPQVENLTLVDPEFRATDLAVAVLVNLRKSPLRFALTEYGHRICERGNEYHNHHRS